MAIPYLRATTEGDVMAVPPGPRGHFLAGNGPEITQKGLLAFFIDVWREYGQAVQKRIRLAVPQDL